MDGRSVVWDAANRRHLGDEHPERGISLEEVEEVLADPDRVEVYLTDRRAYQVVGRTSVGAGWSWFGSISAAAATRSTCERRRGESSGG